MAAVNGSIAAKTPEVEAIRDAGVLQFAYREILSRRMIGLTLTTMCVIVGVFTVTGPIGTYDALSPMKRLAYWALAVGVGWFICYSKSLLTLYFMRFRSLFESALAMTVTTLSAAMPVTAVLYTVEGLFRPDYPAFAGLLTMYAIVATVIALLSVLYFFIVYQLVKHAGHAGAPTVAAANENGGHEFAHGVVAHGDAAVAPPVPDAFIPTRLPPSAPPTPTSTGLPPMEQAPDRLVAHCEANSAKTWAVTSSISRLMTTTSRCSPPPIPTSFG